MPSLRDYLEIRSAVPTSFSPDGSKVLVLSNLTGTFQPYTVRQGGELRSIVQLDEPVGATYLPTEDEVLVSMDSGGNERHQLYLVDDDGGALRPLVHQPSFIHRSGGASRDGALLAYASNARNGLDFHVYVPAPRGLRPRRGPARLRDGRMVPGRRLLA